MKLIISQINLLTCILGSLSLGVIEIGRNCDDSIFNGFAQISFSCFLHFGQDHGGNFFRSEGLFFTFEFNLNLGLATIIDKIERPMFHIPLDSVVAKVSTNETFGVEHGVAGIHGHLVFGGISNQPFGVGKGNIGGGSSVTLKNNKTIVY